MWTVSQIPLAILELLGEEKTLVYKYTPLPPCVYLQLNGQTPYIPTHP